jgi:hypothetical protein
MGQIILLPLRRKACCGFFQSEKSDGFGREQTRDLGYQRPACKPLDHRSRYISIYISSINCRNSILIRSTYCRILTQVATRLHSFVVILVDSMTLWKPLSFGQPGNHPKTTPSQAVWVSLQIAACMRVHATAGAVSLLGVAATDNIRP